MIAYSHCEQPSSCSTPNNHTNKSIRKPDLPSSPSTSGSICQELSKSQQRQAQRKLGRGIEDLSKSPLRELDDSTPDRKSGTRGQKRKRVCPGSDKVRKRCKKNELNTSTVACIGNQSDAEEQETCLNSTPDSNSSEAPKDNGTITDPIQYWACNQRWPEDFANMSREQSASPKKRASSSSYTQRRKDGEVPEAYSAAYEKHLINSGMNMEESAGRSRVSESSKLLCDQLLRATHREPQNTMFPISQFMPAWERVQNRNEARVFRDITPLLVPSPELLSVSGHDELQHLVEEINVEWTKCKALGGPRPKPDFAIGLASSAFSEEEMAKLKNYASPEQPAAFTDHLYFPFVLCEAKCGDQGIRRADRQNMHSGSIAVNAITVLNKTLGPENMNVLDGETLVYSISHDNERVKLYGHLMHQGTFYRYPIASFVLNFEEHHGWKRTHDFFREVYRLVYPTHLKRIQGALAAMADPRKVSITSSITSESVEESDPGVHSSQETAIFKKPGAPASKKQKNEMDLLREQLIDMQRQYIEQQKQFVEVQRQNIEQREQLVEVQRQYIEQRQMAEQQRQNKD